MLKIHKQQFTDYFGGMMGDPTCTLHGDNITFKNWYNMKLDKLSKMQFKDFFTLNYQDS